ncbi:PREDICTED: uncharacterized protein LOC109468070 [Branchiostoma belcheri]|uniref:Uncharacterized protein LOC109468070 n=1 Tax=Branchiostoma belcheri TaxID=7741 RepID=A0A6P4YX75_BRABE|nr:PREDICTED: uncharacterized protein LOC109468070 [Branchiostoma belcheri]
MKKAFFTMKKAVGVGLPLVLILAVSVYLIGTLSWEEEQLSKPGHRVIKRSISLPHADLHEVLRTAASEHAPEYVKNHALVQDALRAAAGKDAPDYLKNRAVGQEPLQAVAADEDAPVYVKNPAIVRDVPRAEAAENVYVKNPEIVQEAPRASAVEDAPAYVNKLAIVRDAPRAEATKDVYVKNPEIVQEAPRAAAAEDSLDYLKNQALVQDALREAAAEDAPTDAKDKRFVPAIANLAGQLFSSEGGFDADKLTETIKKLGSMENMAPDIMAQSVQHEAEVEAQVEKQVAQETVDKILGTYEHDKKDADGDGDDDGGGGGGGDHEIKAEVDFVADKGMVQDDMFAPPGLHMRVDVEQDPGKDGEPDQSSQPMAYGYPVGMGAALMNGCFGTGYKAGDPCYNVRDVIPACYNMMEGCGYIGVGFDGRGDYSSTSRRKSVVQRNCKNLATYEIFLDEISPDTLSLPFLRDFLALPTNFILGKLALQKFIIRYGTHFIKSAKFGGSFRLFKTQEASKTESLEDFSIQAQASYNSLFFNAGGHFGVGSSKGSSQSDKTSSTHVTVEGGDQEVASIVADFYSTGFKDTFTEWLKSIPTYPKPIEMFMGTMSELLNLNYKLLFPFDITDVADGCFSQSLKTEEGTGRKYYEVGKMVNNSQGVMKPVKEKRYCDFTSADKFEKEMDKKRLALERAIAVYMEEGPVPTTDFRLEGGKPGCTSQALKVKGGISGTTSPTWMELINGDTYKLIFDLPENINDDITKSKEVFLVFALQRWNCHAPGAEVHMYNSRNNGESGDTRKKKVSCYGFVMTYQEASGTFIVTQEDQDASTQVLGRLPRSYVDWTVARAEYVSPMEHARATGGALANIVQAPCHVKWSNSYQIKPAEEGGRCLYFVAASAGDIFAVFSAIPRDVSTWYHLQISYQGVALYKGMKLVKYEGAKSARSLGDSKLFQPYFICLEEDAEMMRTYIKYGVGSDTSETGLVYMVYIYQGPPLGIRFYSFGSGEKPVEIMDARVIEGGATGDMECTGGTVLKDGICVEDCHPECNGCIPTSPGSKLNTECRSCKHVSFKNEAGRTECIAECPTGTQPAGVDGRTCLGVNVAMGKTAYQSSTGTGPASRAVDGITDGDFESSSCSHTKLDTGEPYPSWWVDLGQPMQIGRVVIWNRMDCCSDRINDFNIHIGNNTQVSLNPKCGGNHRIEDLGQQKITINCPGMWGRYVGVRLPGYKRILSLCEVQAFAALVMPNTRLSRKRKRQNTPKDPEDPPRDPKNPSKDPKKSRKDSKDPTDNT